MESEGAAMYDAACALREAMIELQLACDGGKDSLSMAATAGEEVRLFLNDHSILLSFLLFRVIVIKQQLARDGGKDSLSVGATARDEMLFDY